MADYKYSQQSGTNWKVNTSDKADSMEDCNELRAVVDDLGAALGHSLKDGSFPEDLASGGTITQITFPASQNASTGVNTLDDYEEGTWTAVIRGSGTAGTYEIDSQFSNYTKIGRVVHLESYITMAGSITGGGTGSLHITGCPFIKMANSHSVGSIYTSEMDFTGTYLNVRFVTSATVSTLLILETVDNNAVIVTPISAISAGDVLNFSITFFE